VRLWLGAIDQGLAVQPIHGDYEIEALEVRLDNATRRLTVEGNAPPPCRLAGAPVRRLTLVIGVRPRGVDEDIIGQTRVLYALTKHTFRGWRPAYVAHAYEQNRSFGFFQGQSLLPIPQHSRSRHAHFARSFLQPEQSAHFKFGAVVLRMTMFTSLTVTAGDS
jgi:hypothetical protein